MKRLRVGIARDNFMDLPRWSAGWRENEAAHYRAVADAGYEAVMGVEAGPFRDAGLLLFGHGVVPKAADAEPYAALWKRNGAEAASCIVGTGMESDAEADALVQAVLSASRKVGMPVYIETHRASITQDPWRCAGLAQRNPDVRFNCDFSHWYTGLDTQALDMDAWLQLIQPVLSRVRMLHGRVGNRCCMQVALSEATKALAVHRRVWSAAMQAFANNADGQNDLWFFPELLGSTYEYVRVFNGEEETDRWLDAALLADAARSCALEAGLETASVASVGSAAR